MYHTMTKQELLENHTTEQLADMVVALETATSGMRIAEKINKQCNNKQCVHEKIEIIAKCPDCGKSEQLIRNKLTDKVHVLEDENKNLKSELSRKEAIVNQIDDILN